MKGKEQSYSLALVSIALFLFLLTSISSAASSCCEQNNSYTTTYAYIPSFYNKTVYVIDTATYSIIDILTGIGEDSGGVAATPNGKKVYVAGGIEHSDTLSIINTSTNNISTLNVGRLAFSVAATDRRVYVTHLIYGVVSVIDAATDVEIDRVDKGIGDNPTGIVVTQDGSKVYVTDESHYGTVSIIDTATNNVTAIVPVGNNPSGIAVTPDGFKVYVANQGSNNVSVIDTATNNVTATVPVGKLPQEVAVNPMGTKVYVTNGESCNVSVIDTTTNNVTDTIDLGIDSSPYGIEVDPNGKKVYVTDIENKNFDVIDIATKDIKTVKLGTEHWILPYAFGKFIVTLGHEQ